MYALLLAVSLLCAFLVQPAHALTLGDQEVLIQVDDLLVPHTPSNEAKNVKIESNDKSSIGLSLSSGKLLFDPLIPTNPLTRSQDIQITGKNHAGYTLFARQYEPFTDRLHNRIPDTSCDNGTCSPTKATLWENTLTFGFGFRCENSNGAYCHKDFEASEHTFMRFASQIQNEPYRPVLWSPTSNPGSARMLYKINIAGTQPPGLYETSLHYILMPSL